MVSQDNKPESKTVDIPRDLDFVSDFGRSQSQTSTIVGDLLKFRKGDWSAGTGLDQKKVLLGTTLIANGDLMQVGWVRWEDERPVDQVMGKVTERFQPPRREELSDPPGPNGQKNPNWPLDDEGNLADPWAYTTQLVLKDTADGALYTFTAASKGGRNAIGLLAKAWVQHLKEGFNDYPIVSLGADTYRHKRYGLIDIPLLEVVGWASLKDWDADIKPAAPKAEAPKAKAAPTGRRDVEYS